MFPKGCGVRGGTRRWVASFLSLVQSSVLPLICLLGYLICPWNSPLIHLLHYYRLVICLILNLSLNQSFVSHCNIFEQLPVFSMMPFLSYLQKVIHSMHYYGLTVFTYLDCTQSTWVGLMSIPQCDWLYWRLWGISRPEKSQFQVRGGNPQPCVNFNAQFCKPHASFERPFDFANSHSHDVIFILECLLFTLFLCFWVKVSPALSLKFFWSGLHDREIVYTVNY